MFDIQEELKKLPDKPGVYLMKDESGEIIYVGKAAVLKNRVRQYFQSSRNHSPKTIAMVEKIREFEYIVTDSEVEALILECNLIKKYKPRFNIVLKDDKTYPYIKVTIGEEYPRVLFTRKIVQDGSRYFGPYASAGAVRETLDILKKLFPMKTCNKVLPRDVGKTRPCLNYFIGRCLAPCQGGVNKDEYMAMIRDICTFLSGGQEELIGRMEKKMEELAENFEFEKAAEVRDKINSIRLIAEKQKVLSAGSSVDQDVFGYYVNGTDACVQVFFVRGGKLIGRKPFLLEGSGDTEPKELLSSFVKQFYTDVSYVPNEVLLQADLEEEMEAIAEWLSSVKGKKVEVRNPKRGEKAELVKMVSENAKLYLKQYEDRLSREGSIASEGLDGLVECTGLASPPHRIEAYDISNTGTTEMVASMVVFEDGKPNKKEYRKFKMKGADKQDDYACMQETLFRRFRYAQREMKEMDRKAGKFTKLPDLILVDGGLGHVHAALQVMEELNLKIPVWGMVKDDRHRTRGLVSEDREIDLADNLPVLRFVTAIQDEAHRFALAYNKQLRRRRHSRSVLEEIEGIGAVRSKELLKYFKSIEAIRRASVEEIAKVNGMNLAAAEKVWKHFHPHEIEISRNTEFTSEPGLFGEQGDD